MNIFELDGILGVGIMVICGCWLVCCPLMPKEDKKKVQYYTIDIWYKVLPMLLLQWVIICIICTWDNTGFW